MKKWMACLSALAAALLLFAGCSKPQEEAAAPGDVIVGENPCDVYFGTGNDYYDLYLGCSGMSGPEITLLTREYVDPEAIQVSLDIQAEYEVYVNQQVSNSSLSTYEITESNGRREVTFVASGDGIDFPLYLYQIYAGLDWDEVGAAWTQYQTIAEQYQSGEATEEQVDAAGAAYQNLVTKYADEYMELTVEELPSFFFYTIQIVIYSDAGMEETLTSAQVTVGDTVYDVPLGEIRIHPTPDAAEDNQASEYLTYTVGQSFWVNCYPYGDGIEKIGGVTYYAQQPLTITGLSYLENTVSTAEVLDVTVVLGDDAIDVSTGEGLEIFWDGNTPIYVEQGQYVVLFFTIHDERMKEINYNSKLWPVIEFECDGGEWACYDDLVIYRYYTDRWLLYALGLDGMNLESYFNDYYYAVVSTWRNAYVSEEE